MVTQKVKPNSILYKLNPKYELVSLFYKTFLAFKIERNSFYLLVAKLKNVSNENIVSTVGVVISHT